MKDKKNKHIKIIANKIANLERECSLGNNVQENMKKIQDVTDSLSLEEILQIDEYITKKKLLTR